MPLSGQKFKELHTALRSAFPSVGDLRLMVRVGLEANLDDISIRSNLQEIVQDLISWAEQRDEVEKLVTAARKENSTYPELKAFRLDPESAGGTGRRRVVHLPQRASLFFLDAGKILEKIESAFQKSVCVALHGIGGIGKSETARQHAHQCGDHYEGGVFWITAPDIETARDSLVALASDEALLSACRRMPNATNVSTQCAVHSPNATVACSSTTIWTGSPTSVQKSARRPMRNSSL
jgi:hypothetical protein